MKETNKLPLVQFHSIYIDTVANHNQVKNQDPGVSWTRGLRVSFHIHHNYQRKITLGIAEQLRLKVTFKPHKKGLCLRVITHAVDLFSSVIMDTQIPL